MKRIFITAMVSIVAGGYAFAADLPQPPPPQAPVAYVPVPVPVYNWGGIYVGINGGWGFGNAKWTANTPVGAVSGTVSDNGGVVGGTLGANFQANQLVLGVEGDFDYSGINTGTSSTICALVGTCQTGNNWLATFRGRVGFAMDRVLFYGTAGGAFGNMQTTLNGVGNTNTQVGWTAGLGAEFAFADNWTAKVEYLYVDLGSTNFNNICSSAACLAANGGLPLTVNLSTSLTENLVRVGLNYKFNY
jgi:outer membrane immunogenic protein